MIRCSLALRGTLLMAAFACTSLAGSDNAQAQPFPFSFELHKLNQVRLYDSRGTGTPENSLTYATFFKSSSGRLRGAEISLSCDNSDVPAALEKQPKESARSKLHYDLSMPLNAKFTCNNRGELWTVDYRTSVSVDGDVYTFDGSVRGVKNSDRTWIKTASEQVTIVVGGGACIPRSVKQETVDEFFGHTRVSRVATNGAETLCKLNAR